MRENLISGTNQVGNRDIGRDTVQNSISFRGSGRDLILGLVGLVVVVGIVAVAVTVPLKLVHNTSGASTDSGSVSTSSPNTKTTSSQTSRKISNHPQVFHSLQVSWKLHLKSLPLQPRHTPLCPHSPPHSQASAVPPLQRPSLPLLRSSLPPQYSNHPPQPEKKQ